MADGATPTKESIAHSERIAVLETRLNSFDRSMAIAAAQLERSAERLENATLKFTAEAVKLNSSVDEMRREIVKHESDNRTARESVAADVATLRGRIDRKSGEHKAIGDAAKEGGSIDGILARHAAKLILVLLLVIAGLVTGNATKPDVTEVTKTVLKALQEGK
jgi:hypothetical protein